MSGARILLVTLFVALVAFAALGTAPASAEPVTRVDRLEALADRFETELEARRPALYDELRARRSPAFAPLNADRDLELSFIGPRNRPFWLAVENLDAAETVSADEVWPGGGGGFALTGSGATLGRLGVWDAGGVRTSHQEFGGRAVQGDSPGGTHYHSTHVAGTMIAFGVDSDARGMSYAGELECYDWNSAESEMASAAASGMWLSNHSYGYVTGWRQSSTGDFYWYGDRDIDPDEDYGFGFYDAVSEEWDQIAHDAPYYLIVKSAGNDRNDDYSGGHYHWDSSENDWVWDTDSHDADGGTTGFDSISWRGTAKNILTVGAVDDVPGGYTNPGGVAMSSFSGWGPTDDGRIKPDLVANGILLYSTMDGSDTDYTWLNGTSMSSPNACGSANLVIDHYRQTHGSLTPTAALTKAILLQTTDEAGGADGPDYEFGWGLMNTLSAVQLVQSDVAEPGHLWQATLNHGAGMIYYFTQDVAGPVRITIAWTDVPGTPPADALNPPDLMLVNDLDMVLMNAAVPARAQYFPWVLDPANPGNAATTGDNFRDNVEQIWVANLPTGDYELHLFHKNSLSGGSQDYAIASSVALADTAAVQPGTSVDVIAGAPAALEVNVAPNPFGTATTVDFALPTAGRARVDIVDVQGRVIRTLADAELPAGTHTADWNGRDGSGRRAASGVYFARVSVAGARTVEKVVLLRGN